MDDVSVLIPAYNEHERIGATVAAVKSIATEARIREIIVVDDGSTDDTSERADSAGADVTLRRPHQGKGAALEAARLIAVCPILLLLDADLGDSAVEAMKLVQPIFTGGADMTIARFPDGAGKGGGAGFVVRLARWGIRKLTRQVMASPLSGQRAIRRDVIEEIGGFASGWGTEIALTVEALRHGHRVLEIPVTMTHRVTGRSYADIIHRARQFFDAVRVLFRLWREPRELPTTGPSDAVR